MVDDLSSNDGMDLRNSARAGWAEEERHRRSPDPFKGNSITSSWENDKVSCVNEHLVNMNLWPNIQIKLGTCIMFHCTLLQAHTVTLFTRNIFLNILL